MNQSTRLSLLSLVGTLLICGCAEFNDPYYGNQRSGYGGSYNDPYSRDRDSDYNRRRRWEDERHERREEQREIDRERDRLEAERRRLEAEREAARRAPPPRREEHCPSGFSPSEQKCSSQERRHGCQDMRLPGGLGCVKR